LSNPVFVLSPARIHGIERNIFNYPKAPAARYF
jgi:hypothetical protein